MIINSILYIIQSFKNIENKKKLRFTSKKLKSKKSIKRSVTSKVFTGLSAIGLGSSVAAGQAILIKQAIEKYRQEYIQNNPQKLDSTEKDSDSKDKDSANKDRSQLVLSQLKETISKLEKDKLQKEKSRNKKESNPSSERYSVSIPSAEITKKLQRLKEREKSRNKLSEKNETLLETLTQQKISDLTAVKRQHIENIEKNNQRAYNDVENTINDFLSEENTLISSFLENQKIKNIPEKNAAQLVKKFLLDNIIGKWKKKIEISTDNLFKINDLKQLNENFKTTNQLIEQYKTFITKLTENKIVFIEIFFSLKYLEENVLTETLNQLKNFENNLVLEKFPIYKFKTILKNKIQFELHTLALKKIQEDIDSLSLQNMEQFEDFCTEILRIQTNLSYINTQNTQAIEKQQEIKADKRIEEEKKLTKRIETDITKLTKCIETDIKEKKENFLKKIKEIFTKIILDQHQEVQKTINLHQTKEKSKTFDSMHRSLQEITQAINLFKNKRKKLLTFIENNEIFDKDQFLNPLKHQASEKETEIISGFITIKQRIFDFTISKENDLSTIQSNFNTLLNLDILRDNSLTQNMIEESNNKLSLELINSLSKKDIFLVAVQIPALLRTDITTIKPNIQLIAENNKIFKNLLTFLTSKSFNAIYNRSSLKRLEKIQEEKLKQTNQNITQQILTDLTTIKSKITSLTKETKDKIIQDNEGASIWTILFDFIKNIIIGPIEITLEEINFALLILKNNSELSPKDQLEEITNQLSDKSKKDPLKTNISEFKDTINYENRLALIVIYHAHANLSKGITRDYMDHINKELQKLGFGEEYQKIETEISKKRR